MDNGVTFVILTNGPAALDEIDPKVLGMNNALVPIINAITAWPLSVRLPK